jgi:hypothetical protein
MKRLSIFGTVKKRAITKFLLEKFFRNADSLFQKAAQFDAHCSLAN